MVAHSCGPSIGRQTSLCCGFSIHHQIRPVPAILESDNKALRIWEDTIQRSMEVGQQYYGWRRRTALVGRKVR